MSTAIQEAFHTIAVTRGLMALAMLVFLGFAVQMARSLKESRSGWLAVGGLILLGLALRLGWIAWTQPVPLSDFQVYWQFANQFYHGDLTYNVIIRHPGIMLLYSFAFQWLGASMGAVWAANLFFSAVLMLSVFALGKQMMGRRPAFFALFMSAILPQFITFSALTASETPAITLSVLILWALLHSRTLPESRQALHWLGLGVLLYGTIMVRSTNILYLGVIPLVMVLMHRHAWRSWAKRYLLMAATTGLLLSTWVYHQYLVGGSPRLFWGDELWLACAVQYDREGGYTDIHQMAFYPRVKAAYDKSQHGGIQNEIEFFRQVGQESWRIVEADPARYLQVGLLRLKNTLWTSQTGLRWTQKGSPRLQHSLNEKTIHRIATVSNVWWQILLCLSPFGFLAAWFQARRQALSPMQQECYWYLGLFSLLWMGFHYLLAVGSERYGFQLIPFVLLLSTSTLSWLAQASGFFNRSTPSRNDRSHSSAAITA